MKLDILKYTEYIKEGFVTHHIEIKSDKSSKEAIFKLLDQELLFIYLGREDRFNLKYVKEKLKCFFCGKDPRIIKGAVAELFTHLLLKLLGYEQKCCFKNLEEGSMKKGFDGVYIDPNDSELWYMESKSGSLKKPSAHHFSFLKIAIDDLTKKITTGIANDPWQNALSHADSVNAEDTIKAKFIRLSEMFSKKEYLDISNFNIIPASSVFVESCNEIAAFELEKIEKRHDEIGAKQHMLICCTHDLLSLFEEYLNMDDPNDS